MRKIITTTLMAIGLMLPAAQTLAAGAPEIGKIAPDFEATDINGKAFKLSDHKGKIVVLEWSNHKCPFVRKHYDSGNMQKTQKDANAKDVEWITIVSSAKGRQGHIDAKEAAKITKTTGASPDVKILDPSGKIGKLYDAKTTPHMFVIDTSGTLAYAGAIDSNSSPNPATIEGAQNYVTAAINDLTAGNPVTTPQTAPYGCSVKYAY